MSNPQMQLRHVERRMNAKLLLTGIDGANPVGYMAAIGTLEALTEVGVQARLHWTPATDWAGAWRPVLSGTDLTLDAVIEAIDRDRDGCQTERALLLGPDVKVPPAVMRAHLQALVAEYRATGRRRGVDLAAGLASDVVVDGKGNTKPTALHFTAGQRQFLAIARELADGVTPDDLREALLGPWRYRGKLPSFNWDALGVRDFALRGRDPSTDERSNVGGADWLAFRSLAAFPTFPTSRRLETAGVTWARDEASGKQVASLWLSLWATPLDRAMVRSIPRLDVAHMRTDARERHGIAAVYRAPIVRDDRGGGSFAQPIAA